MAIGTGHGAILTFTGGDLSPLGNGNADNGVYLIRDLNLWDESAEAPDFSHLGVGRYRIYGPPDLFSVGQMTFNVLFNNERQDVLTGSVYEYPLPRVEGTFHATLGSIPTMSPVVLTYPRRTTTLNTSATMSGNAAVVSRNFGNLISNQEHLCPVSLQWQSHPIWAEERTV